MSDLSNLEARIESAFTTVTERVKGEQQKILQDFLNRQELLKRYEQAQARVVEIARPRLQALADRAGARAKLTPYVSQTLRAVTFEFRSAKARMTLSFSVAPDYPVQNAVVECDLTVLPVLWTFDKHAEFRTPVEAVDGDGLARWLDDRIVAFVELYIRIHEDEVYAKEDYVEDPVAGVKFPKFAAGATLEHDGRTHYFIDDRTKEEFARQNRIATA